MLVVLFLGLFGCSEQVALALKPGVPVDIEFTGTGKTLTLRPGTESYGRFSHWLAKNTWGWEPYLGTPPAKGIWLRVGDTSLQFLDTQVIAHTHHGVSVKRIDPDECTFLHSGDIN